MLLCAPPPPRLVSGPGGQPLGGGCEGGVSASDWRKCQAVARIIASCPAQASSVEEYYAIVCPQVRRCVCALTVVCINGECLVCFNSRVWCDLIGIMHW